MIDKPIDLLKKRLKNRIFNAFGCIIALLPIESTIVYLYTLPIAVGLTEIFSKMEFIAFSLILAIAINSVFISLVIFPLYDYIEDCRIYKIDEEIRERRIKLDGDKK
jgi:hypothetical protein